jgi:hypothetical protein
MTKARSTPLLVLVLAGCPSNDTNPAVLWLAPDMAETHVKLQDSEPNPY